LIAEDLRQESQRTRSKQTALAEEREAEKNELAERNFRDGLDRVNEHGANMIKQVHGGTTL
jgi:hypothetical protein